jgi:hypothetical protein
LLLNSLSGRFGMEDSFKDITVIDSKNFSELEEFMMDSVKKITPLGDKLLIEQREKGKDVDTFLDSGTETHNVSIGIASAITAYARIYMSHFKNNPNFILYYSDTDSAYLDRPLPDYMVSNTELGNMKLEYVLNKAIFLSPKMYYLETESGKIIYKVKGFKHEVELTENDFENLLFKESFLEKVQTK